MRTSCHRGVLPSVRGLKTKNLKRQQIDVKFSQQNILTLRAFCTLMYVQRTTHFSSSASRMHQSPLLDTVPFFLQKTTKSYVLFRRGHHTKRLLYYNMSQITHQEKIFPSANVMDNTMNCDSDSPSSTSSPTKNTNGFSLLSSLWNTRKVADLFRSRSPRIETNDVMYLQHSSRQHPYLGTSMAIHINSSCSTTNNKHNIRNNSKRFSVRKIRRSLHSDDVEELSITGRRLRFCFVKVLENYSLSQLTMLCLNRNQLYRDKHLYKRLLQNLPIALHDLSLCWNGLDESTATILANRLRQLENLKSISLAGNPIGPNGIQCLIEEGNLHHIQTVNLSDCDVGDEGVTTLGYYLQLKASKVEHLKLDMNTIGDIGLIALANGLKINQSMISLDLYCNDFGELGVKSLMSATCSRTSNLQILSLRANRIGDDGAKVIASKLNRCTSLQSLNIGYNEIGDEGGIAIAESLTHNTTALKELTMSWNSLGNKSISAFALALTQNECLELCRLDENPQVGRRGASAFVQTLKSNTTLKTLEVLNRSYENHLLHDKLDFLTKVCSCRNI